MRATGATRADNARERGGHPSEPDGFGGEPGAAGYWSGPTTWRNSETVAGNGRNPDRGGGRPALPELAPTGGGQPIRSADAATAPGWASWLNESAWANQENDHGQGRAPAGSPYDLATEDPMAALVIEARRRAAQTQRRMRIRRRALAIAGVSLALVVVAVVGWWGLTPEKSSTPRAIPVHATASPSTTGGNQPGLIVWCQERNTPDRVSGASAGDLGTGPGVIMRLEYAWYVLRDPAAVRALLAPDAKVAPEQATRDAITATPAGTKHCVNITGVDPDHWNVSIDEKHPDGTQVSWQQVITTVTRDGQVRISAITDGSR
ncbi:hypothetical protein ACFXHA_29235 [Nocardia sp. NPDC059240]|uniref:hypothetical protein n=1 Tax=Nocardia sp. NPDC059240 TaxID=3346786 RepID=UPI00367B2ABA